MAMIGWVARKVGGNPTSAGDSGEMAQRWLRRKFLSKWSGLFAVVIAVAAVSGVIALVAPRIQATYLLVTRGTRLARLHFSPRRSSLGGWRFACGGRRRSRHAFRRSRSR
jgi:hypothetical protein